MHAQVKAIIFGLIVVAGLAFGAYAICTWVARRPGIGRTAAAVIAVLGCAMVLLDNV